MAVNCLQNTSKIRLNRMSGRKWNQAFFFVVELQTQLLLHPSVDLHNGCISY